MDGANPDRSFWYSMRRLMSYVGIKLAPLMFQAATRPVHHGGHSFDRIPKKHTQ